MAGASLPIATARISLGAAVRHALAAAALALLAACGPRIETEQYAFDVPRLDGLAETPANQVALIDLTQIFLSDTRLSFKDQEIPARYETVRVVAINGTAVPETSGYGEISPGLHVFDLTLSSTEHRVVEPAESRRSGEPSLETLEFTTKRRLTLNLKPAVLLGFDAEGRPLVEPIERSLFGPEGACERQGLRDRLCWKCERDDGNATCVRTLHHAFYELAS